MSNKSIKNTLSKQIRIILFTINIIFGIIFGIIVRNYQINKSLANIQNNINNSVDEINNYLDNNNNKVDILSEIVLSQINNTRAFYEFNSLFKYVLSSNPDLNSLHITLAPNYILIAQDMYNLRDSLNRFNVSWYKNTSNIIYIDSVNYSLNNSFYQILKNKPQLTIFDTKTINQTDKVISLKSVVFPLFDGTKFVGIFGYSINFNFIYNVLFDNDLTNNTFICDEDGRILYDRNKLTSVGKNFTNITNENFKNTEKEIIHNIDFSKRHNGELLIFHSFINSYGTTWKIGTIIPSRKIYLTANTYMIGIILFFVLITIFLILISQNYINKFLSLFFNFSNSIDALRKGEITDEIEEISSYQEVRILSLYLDSLRQRLLKLTELHQGIKDQNLDIELKTYGKTDILGNSITEAIAAIKERSSHRKKAMESEKRNEWINEGLNLIHEAARITGNSLEDLTDKITKKISLYTDAFLSSIFIYFDEEKKEPVLRAISTYGLDTKRAFKKEISLSEGVVGSVAIERKSQYFDKIPDDYHIIVGGLSEMKPKSILIQKLEYEDEFFGILEIAFLRKLEQYELNFFDAASAEIALSIKNLLSNLKTNILLDKMKVQTTEIEKTKEILQAKVKEISKKEHEAKKNQADLQSMINAVNNTLMTIEYTTKGILLTANTKYLSVMHYTLSEIQGVNVLDLVKSERSELERVIERVSKGEYFEKIMKRFTKFGEVKWLYSTYTPYYDSKGNITKVLYFAFDVTETKKHNEKLEKEISMFKKQVKILRTKI